MKWDTVYLETKNELYQSLFEAYQKDMHDRSIEKKVILSIQFKNEKKYCSINSLLYGKKTKEQRSIYWGTW